MNLFRRKASPVSWLRRLFGPGRRPQADRRASRRRPLTLEALEDRTLLDGQFVDLGPLRFFGDTLHQVDTKWEAADGAVTIGYAPTQGEDFLGLVEVELASGTGPQGILSLDTSVAPAQFSI